MGGVQRYALALQQRLADCTVTVEPTKPMHGIRGHLWEQVVLPRLVRNGLLWSPANTGPLSVANQVLTVHDIGSLEHPEWYNSVFAAWYRWLTPRLLRKVRRIITASRFSRDRLLALMGVDEAKIAVVPIGVDPHFRPCCTEEILKTTSELGIPSPHYLLNLGTLEPRKNLRRLLAAWASCVERLPKEVWLVIAGSETPASVFKNLELDSIPQRVHFAGFVADRHLPSLYSGALSLVYVSVYEGFGLPALEAMACGTVPIVAQNSSLPEVVGDAGFLVDPFDIENIATAITQLVERDELRSQLRARATRRSHQFTWEQTAKNTWDVLQQAMIS